MQAFAKFPGMKPGDLTGHNFNQTRKSRVMLVYDSSPIQGWPGQSWGPFALKSTVYLISHPARMPDGPAKKPEEYPLYPIFPSNQLDNQTTDVNLVQLGKNNPWIVVQNQTKPNPCNFMLICNRVEEV